MKRYSLEECLLEKSYFDFIENGRNKFYDTMQNMFHKIEQFYQFSKVGSFQFTFDNFDIQIKRGLNCFDINIDFKYEDKFNQFHSFQDVYSGKCSTTDELKVAVSDFIKRNYEVAWSKMATIL